VTDHTGDFDAEERGIGNPSADEDSDEERGVVEGGGGQVGLSEVGAREPGDATNPSGP
jgi:hypothetical protein